MNLPLIDDKTFRNQNYTTDILTKGEFSNCTFIDCIFENSDLSNNFFLECEFINCNLSNVNVMHSTFNDVSFKDCKLVGVLFQNCNAFLLDFRFTNCTLNLSSFYQLKINKTRFLDCKMHQVDFTETEAQNVLFEACDFKDAIFDHTNLVRADFSTAFNFSINPSDNILKGAIFSKDNLSGLLHDFAIKIK